MIAIRGAGSQIVSALFMLLPTEPREQVVVVPRDTDMPLNAERYLFCQGLIRPRRGRDQTAEQIGESFRVNCWFICEQCDRIFAANPRARVCVIGSESGISGSFDDVYAAAKRSLHEYVEKKRLLPDQQLVCVAPSIMNSGMTLQREDKENLERRRTSHPKRRFIEPEEVAAVVRFVLYGDRGYLSNVVIRMNGGGHL